MKIWRSSILRYGLGLLIALSIFWGFYYFIKDDNWLAVSALATLVLALVTFLSIMELRSARKDERRERVLDNILNWAEALDDLMTNAAFVTTAADRFTIKRELLRFRNEFRGKLRMARIFKKEKLPAFLAKMRDDMDAYMSLKENEPVDPKQKQFKRSIKRLIDAILDIKSKQIT